MENFISFESYKRVNTMSEVQKYLNNIYKVLCLTSVRKISYRPIPAGIMFNTWWKDTIPKDAIMRK